MQSCVPPTTDITAKDSIVWFGPMSTTGRMYHEQTRLRISIFERHAACFVCAGARYWTGRGSGVHDAIWSSSLGSRNHCASSPRQAGPADFGPAVKLCLILWHQSANGGAEHNIGLWPRRLRYSRLRPEPSHSAHQRFHPLALHRMAPGPHNGRHAPGGVKRPISKQLAYSPQQQQISILRSRSQLTDIGTTHANQVAWSADRQFVKALANERGLLVFLIPLLKKLPPKIAYRRRGVSPRSAFRAPPIALLLLLGSRSLLQ